MQNLLTQPLDEASITAALGEPGQPPLLPRFGSDAWKAAFEKSAVRTWMKPIRTLAEEELASPLPPLTDELYAEFRKNGSRLPFERVYFERRRRLARAALCALAEPDRQEHWREPLLAKIEGVFGEESWALNAHVSATSGKDPVCLDLFAGETANLMGDLLTIFGEIMPPDLAARIRQRLRANIFDTYLTEAAAQSWKVWWMKSSSNWNAVCHQGIIGAALSVEEPALVARMLVTARQALQLFLSGFGADGGSSEGPAYWSYGFGWFATLNRQLETRSQGRLSLIDGDEHVREIAKFGPRMSLSNSHLVNFADCSPRGGMRPALLEYLGERLDDADSRSLAYANFQQLAHGGFDLHDSRCDVFQLVPLLLSCPDDVSRPAVSRPQDSYFADLGVVVAQDTDRRGFLWEFAVKGGHNAEHHNHNDCGSYLLNINGECIVTDIGAPEYVKDFFQEDLRYTFLAARTLGHSLPIINGCEQACGRDFAAEVLQVDMNDTEVTVRIDLTRCYPAEAGCESCVRELVWHRKEGQLRVTDRFTLSQADSLESAVITESEVTRQGRSAIIANGEIRLEVAPGESCEITGIERHPYSDHHGKPSAIDRIILKPTDLGRETAISYTLRLAE